MTKLTTPTVIKQHEYISINFGNNRRLTASYSGCKASGSIPQAVFDAFCKATDLSQGVSIIQAIEKFAEDIDTIWPQWNNPPKSYAPNQIVKFDFGKRRGGMDAGKVVKVRGTSVTVQWDRNGLIGLTADMLDEFN